FEVPILMILAIILGFYFIRPRLPIRRNLVFVCMIIIETLTILVDLAAVSVDNNYASYGTALIRVINMLYFLAFFVRSYVMYLFSASVMKDTIERTAFARQIIRIPLYFCVIEAFASAFASSENNNNFIFYVDNTGYHAGNMYNLVYVCGFFYVLMSFVSVFLFKKRLGRRREKYGILSFNIFVFAGLVIRLALPKYLLMDTVILMAILVVFLAFGNPEYYIDLRGTAFNRTALSEYFEENKGRFKLASFGMVIHHFVEMRDIYGLAHMEEGLAVIAKYLRQLFPRAIIFYCRNGRFVIMDKPDTDFAQKSAEISKRFKKPWKSENVELYLSVGFVNYDLVNGSYATEVLLKNMLKALEKAGRGETDKPLEITEADLKQTEMENRVRHCIERAIDDTGFELYLQPIVDTKTGMIVGAEALSRIRDTEGDIIPPGIFIPVAENSGRINELGELVFDETCKFIQKTNLEETNIKWINVNLSPVQFLRTDLAERYASMVEKYGINPGLVHLEITEGAMIDDSFLNRQITAMTDKGFKFVLDDYGTGYSNLARVKTCPFENVKLDMSIVRDYCKEPDAILPNMIQAFKHMGFAITAEGIEDSEMAATMKNIGCDFLQGYHYSKPIPAADFAEKYLD
ncbi:MAG: GGDEF domain-containing protein, partial [Lachnospiraceae bacterium]|nr:GGDEF domain-containing protein [Lachnospiraceae bacterium]